MWRSLGWLFVNGWTPVECNRLFLSGLVPTRFGVRREVWIGEDADLAALKHAAVFVTNAQLDRGNLGRGVKNET
jgi:hypothetical protein